MSAEVADAHHQGVVGTGEGDGDGQQDDAHPVA